MERFFPDQLAATQDAVKGFLLSVTAGQPPVTLRHITMDKIIKAVPIINTKAFDAGCDFIYYLLSNGSYLYLQPSLLFLA